MLKSRPTAKLFAESGNIENLYIFYMKMCFKNIFVMASELIYVLTVKDILFIKDYNSNNSKVTTVAS